MKTLLKLAPAMSRKDQKIIKGGFKPCKPGNYACLDVYMPVLCSNGIVYSNGCYASLACQTNCQSVGEI
jgi:hypothetical protein